MAQNPWTIRKCDGVKFRKVEKWFKLFNEENGHLMHISTFEQIHKTLENVFRYRHFVSEKETFRIASIRCVASIRPQNLSNIQDGLRIYLSNFMLKANHDLDGYCLCFRRLKVIKKEPKILNGVSSCIFLAISFKLLYINLRKGLILKTRLIKIEPSQLTVDIFGVIKGTVFNNNAMSAFYTDRDQEVFLKNKKKLVLKDMVSIVINRICFSEDGLVIQVLGKLIE